MCSPMSSSSENSDDEGQRNEIREELSSMSFEEIMKLKEKLGAKVYKEAVLGVNTDKKHDKKTDQTFKRLNRNRPREMSSKKQVPFLGAELRTQRKTEIELRDPRFDEKSGEYDVKNFKTNYRFLTKIRQKEVLKLKEQLNETADDDKQKQIRRAMQRLINQNLEERNWHAKQAMLKQEQQEAAKARAEGKQPHFATKRERRAKELVMKFEKLKETGKLNKHLEKRRKKNVEKDRKRISGFK